MYGFQILSLVHTNEVLQDNVRYGAATTIALDHVHLVGGPGVDVAVSDVADVNVGGKRAHGATTAPVAVDVLNENALGGTLRRVRFETGISEGERLTLTVTHSSLLVTSTY